MVPQLKDGAFVLKNSDKTLLIIHRDPDGDAISSSLALFLSLKNLGKEASLVCKDPLPEIFAFLPAFDLIQNDFIAGDFDTLVLLDSGDLKRTGFSERLKENRAQIKNLINIDHHPKNDIHKLADINIVDYDAAATAVILASLLKEMGVMIDFEVATCLLCGIFTDTGGFKHSNTTSEVLSMASSLLNKGANLKDVVGNIANSKTIPALKLWGIVLSRIKSNRWGLVSSVITLQDIQSCSATAEDLAGIVNLINAIPEAKAAVLFAEPEPGMIKASFRTEDKTYDVARLAAMFGGGGHSKAAGFTIPGKIVKNKEGLQVILKSGPYREKDLLDILDQLLI